MENQYVHSTDPTQTPRRRTQRPPIRCALVIVAGLLAAVAGIAPASAAQGFLSCASNGYKYNYCSADTQGRVVMLREVSTG